MITKEEFLSAKPGDWFVDSDGEIWDVVDRKGDEVTTVLPGSGTIGLFWDTENSQILDSDWTYVRTLNSASARMARGLDSDIGLSIIRTRLYNGAVRFLVCPKKKSAWIVEVIPVVGGMYDGGWIVSEHAPAVIAGSGYLYVDYNRAVADASAVAEFRANLLRKNARC